MDNKLMHKRQLVDEVARRSGPWGFTRRQVRDALHGILDVITDEIAEGNAVTIAGVQWDWTAKSTRWNAGWCLPFTPTTL